MLALVLGSRCRQHKEAPIEIDLTPTQGPDLVAALACEDQQPHDVPVVAGAKCPPDGREFGVGNDPIARTLGCLVSSSNGPRRF